MSRGWRFFDVLGFRFDIVGKGLGGLEYDLDKTLAGHDGKATFEMSAGGRRIPSGVDSERDAVPGKDVALTIDRDIQWVAQKAIAKAVKTTGSESGTVIVMDPRTGDLLAMATAPTFDSNHPGSAPASARGNRAIAEPYEPGSTGKVIRASEAVCVRLLHRLKKAPRIGSHEVPAAKTPTAGPAAGAQLAAPLLLKSASMMRPVTTNRAAATIRMSPLTSASRRCCAHVTQIIGASPVPPALGWRSCHQRAG